MSIFDHLMLLDKVELAKQLAQQAKDNAALKERVKRLEVEIFWARDSLTATPQQNANAQGEGKSSPCWCHTCRPVTISDCRMVLCPKCRNKRCPHANDHRNACTCSNEPGQAGSAYPAAPSPADQQGERPT